MLTAVVVSVASGFLISRIGCYKPVAVAGMVIIPFGMWLLTRLDVHSTNAEAMRDMVVIGVGLGFVMQLFVLAVQNAVPRSEMGVATSASTFFRQVGGTVGITALGALLTSRLSIELPENHQGTAEPGALFSPEALNQLPRSSLETLRIGLANSFDFVFTTSFVLAILALLLTLSLTKVPLRKTLDDEAPLGKDVPTSFLHGRSRGTAQRGGTP
jgi:hypothetical protein